MKYKITLSALLLTFVSVSTLQAQQPTTVWPSAAKISQTAANTVWPTAWDANNPNTPYYIAPNTSADSTNKVTEAPYSDKWEYYCYPQGNWNRGGQNAYRNAPQQAQQPAAQAQAVTANCNIDAELDALKKQHSNLMLESTKTMEVQAAKIDELKNALDSAAKQKDELQKKLDELLTKSEDTAKLDACLAELDESKKQCATSMAALKQELLALQTKSAKAQLALQSATADSDKDGVLDSSDKCPVSLANVKVDKKGCEVDSDNDGIVDSKDECPSSATEAKVNEKGCVTDADNDGVVDSKDKCPASVEGAKVNNTGCVADSDNDGITDDADQCSTTPADTKVDDKGCELDTDKDGVVDSKDKCPASVEGAKVNDTGCVADSDKDGIADDVDQCSTTAVDVKVDDKGCEVDTDKDGVVDSKDQCPTSAADAKVNEKGCMPDTDSDGVTDASDLCPDTKADDKVNDVGCSTTESINLKGVNFQTGSGQLTADSSPTLDEAAATLSKHPTLKLEVGGHTDNTGSVAANERLSQKRAEAVMNYLVSKGVKAENLSAKGYGPSQPIADNATSKGKSENRRVELKIIE